MNGLPKSEKMNIDTSICFDYSHNNTLVIESPSFSDFTQFLFASSFKLGKVQAGFTSLEKLAKYKLLVIGAPQGKKLTPEEIEVIKDFVKNGGSLLVIGDEGGDYGGSTNLSQLTWHFGFEFKDNMLFDSVNFVSKQNRVIIKKFEPHWITRSIGGIVVSSSCSFNVLHEMAMDDNITVKKLASTGINSFQIKMVNGEWSEEEDAPNQPVAVCSYYYKGKVIGLSGASMFSSLSSSYGIGSLNNREFISNIFFWLLQTGHATGSAEGQNTMLNLPINTDLVYWMEETVQEKGWQSVADIVNFAILSLKENYNQLIKKDSRKKEMLQSMLDKRMAELSDYSSEGENSEFMDDGEESEKNFISYMPDSSKISEFEKIMADLRKISNGKVGNREIDDVLNDFHEAQEIQKKDDDLARHKVVEEIHDSDKLKSKKIKEQESSEAEKMSELDKTPILTPEEEMQKTFKNKVDQVLDEAFNSMGSIEDFKSKIDAFKKLADEDEPLN